MQDTSDAWPFDVPRDFAVVTTSYVTKEKDPILYVTHEYTEEDGIVWQFHCGNGDYDASVIQLVRLDEILRIDRGILGLADLPVGYSARRSSPLAAWIVEKEPV